MRAFKLFAVYYLGSATAANMNAGIKYTIANPPSGREGEIQNFTGEWFEVYTPPIISRYSQVIWRNLGDVPLPQDIQTRFHGKIMAITGWEVDVIRKTSGGDVSVPCYQSYNHHYGAAIRSSKARVSDIPGPDHGHGPEDLFEVDNGVGPDWIPQVQNFNEHNGNEARQSFHGLPKGYVQPIWSPSTFTMNPMQINTLNPDGSGKRGGPLPRASKAPPNASYSGLLECPCTTRMKRVLGGHVARNSGVCGQQTLSSPVDPWHPHESVAGDLPVNGATECFDAVATLFGGRSTNLTVSNTQQPSGCSVTLLDGPVYQAVFNEEEDSPVTCGAPGKSRSTGHAEDLVNVNLDIDELSDVVTITLRGIDGKWFGVGFGANVMHDLPYSIIVDGYGNVTERKLGNHEPGSELKQTIKLVSNSVASGERTVVLKRALKGATADYYTFSASLSTVPFINALGGTAHFAQHDKEGASSISLLKLGAATCICRLSGGTINGHTVPPCADWPLSDLKKNKNPSCEASTYAGGLACCGDGVFLLDADQDIPEHVDTVYYKWRFYFEEWDPSKHIQAVHLEWALNGCDSGGGHRGCKTIDYDIPQCASGTPPEECVHTVTSLFTGADMLTQCNPKTEPYCADPRNVTGEGVAFIMAGGHCHAPACISLELWNNDTGDLICNITSKMGDGDEAFDEHGYIWLPHCAWGNPENGLKPPPTFKPETKFLSIKRENSTYYHPGVMAIWQMRGAFATHPQYTAVV